MSQKRKILVGFLTAVMIAAPLFSLKAFAQEPASIFTEENVNSVLFNGGLGVAGASVVTMGVGSGVQDNQTAKARDLKKRQTLDIPKAERALKRREYVNGRMDRIILNMRNLPSFPAAERGYILQSGREEFGAWVQELAGLEWVKGIDLEGQKKIAGDMIRAEKRAGTARNFTRGGAVGTVAGGVMVYVGNAGVSETIEKAKEALSDFEPITLKKAHLKEFVGDQLN